MSAPRNPRLTFAVGVDPGASTGLSIVRGDGFHVHREQGPPSILYDFADRFPFLHHAGYDVLVACERYVSGTGPTARTAQPLTQQTVGVVEQVCVVNGWKLRLQAPADVKALVDDRVLRQLNLWCTGRDVGQRDANDVNDATRHAVALLAQFRASMFDQLLRGNTIV